MNTKQREESLTLEILETIEKKNDVTQRHLANKMGVALGLANSYLKRCVRKGLIKIHQAPANRYLYYLTPKGFAEKSRLTAEYLSVSFDFYRHAGESLKHIYRECETRQIQRVLFCGVSELAEIASLRALEHDIEVIGTFDPDYQKDTFLHVPVWNSFEQINLEFNACLLTALNNPVNLYEVLAKKIDHELILVPSILGLAKNSN